MLLAKTYVVSSSLGRKLTDSVLLTGYCNGHLRVWASSSSHLLLHSRVEFENEEDDSEVRHVEHKSGQETNERVKTVSS